MDEYYLSKMAVLVDSIAECLGCSVVEVLASLRSFDKLNQEEETEIRKKLDEWES